MLTHLAQHLDVKQLLEVEVSLLLHAERNVAPLFDLSANDQTHV
jgi:hypothetical protein